MKGNYLKELRRKNKLPQTGMANKIGISVSYYSKIEGGFKNPSYEALKKIKKEFGVNVDMNNFFK